MGRMEGKDQGSITLGLGAWLDMVAASGQPCGLIDGKNACLAGTSHQMTISLCTKSQLLPSFALS